jgi:hypothetical protein
MAIRKAAASGEPSMRLSALLLLALLGLSGCISSSNPAPPPQQQIVVPPGSTVVCPNGNPPPC